MSFSWFADRNRWYGPRSGTWRFTGMCTANTEQYYVMLHDRGNGWLDSAAERADWQRHLGEKDWFDARDFAAMLARFEAAPRIARRKGHRAARMRANTTKLPAALVRCEPCRGGSHGYCTDLDCRCCGGVPGWMPYRCILSGLPR